MNKSITIFSLWYLTKPFKYIVKISKYFLWRKIDINYKKLLGYTTALKCSITDFILHVEIHIIM